MSERGLRACPVGDPLVSAYNNAVADGNRKAALAALKKLDQHLDTRCRRCHSGDEDEEE